MMHRIILTTFIIGLVVSLKVGLPQHINDTNFEQILKIKPQQFITNGSLNDNSWALLFVINQCQYCKQSNMLFTNSFIEYQKRFHLEDKKTVNLMQKNLQFGVIDCQQSPNLCSLFNIEKYPTLYFIAGNGEICQYIDDQMPYKIMEYLQQRYRQQGSHMCKHIGHMTLLTKVLSYFNPLKEFINVNTALFIFSFIIGPFLFGFIYSRNRKQPQVIQAQIKQQ